MELHYELTKDDMAMARHIQQQVRVSAFRAPIRFTILYTVAVLFFAISGLTIVLLLTSSLFASAYFFLALSAFVGSSAYVMSLKVYWKAYYEHYDEVELGYPIELWLALEDKGVRIRSEGFDGVWSWSRFKSVDEIPTRIVLLTKALSVIVVPNRAFADDNHRNEFLRYIRDKLVAEQTDTESDLQAT